MKDYFFLFFFYFFSVLFLFFFSVHSLVARYSSSNDYHRMRKISLISSILLRFLRFFFALVFLLFLLHEYLVKRSLMHGISVW